MDPSALQSFLNSALATTPIVGPAFDAAQKFAPEITNLVESFLPVTGTILSGNDAIEETKAALAEKSFLAGVSHAPEIGLAALGAIPFLGTEVKGAKAIGEATNAALDLSHAARMKRAEEMGFLPETFYHGTTNSFDAFDNAALGSKTGADWSKQGHFASNLPDDANAYAQITRAPGVADLEREEQDLFNELEKARYSDYTDPNDLKKLEDEYGLRYDEIKQEIADLSAKDINARPQVYPLKVRGNNKATIDMAGLDPEAGELNTKLQKEFSNGADLVIIKNIEDPNIGATHVVAKSPNQFRSLFANFDPSKIDSPDLMAALGSIGLLGAMNAQDEPKY